MKTIINCRLSLLLYSFVLFLFLTACKKNICTIPELSAGDISEITYTSAKCSYKIISDGGKQITARGICWSVEQDPDIEDNVINNFYDNNGYYINFEETSILNIEGLGINTTYYVRAFATNSEGTGYSGQVSFSTLNPGLPSITTSAVSSITPSSAICGGDVTNSGGSGITVTARGLCWSTNPNPTTANSHSTNGSGLGTFSHTITALTYNTTYYVRAYAVNVSGTAYGNEISFTAGQTTTSPVLTTTSVSNITQISATSGGNISSDGGSSITARGVCWSTAINPTTNNSHSTNGTGIGSFVSNILSLTPNTTYHVRAYATNIVGTSYGNDVSFHTLANSVPTVTTTAASNITQSSATSGGVVTNSGNLSVSARGVCWSTSQNPTISNSHTVDGSGLGSFTSSITGLIEGSVYYVKAYATNSMGTAYGSQISFITPTTPSITTNPISNIAETSALGGGNISSDGGSSVTARGVCWSTSQNPTISNSHTNDGSGIGSFTSSITGLSLNVVYYVRAYATNAFGTVYGNEVSFTTALVIGQTYQGGILAYVFQPGDPGYIAGQVHGLIASADIIGYTLTWSNNNYISTSATATELGTGYSNTNIIVGVHGNGSYPAYICKNATFGGYSDWFLPSSDELTKLYLNQAAIGGFIGSYYWSSSECFSQTANAKNFATGSNGCQYKTTQYYFRPVRYF